MKAGAASITINNELGTLIQGAGLPDQRVARIRDDLEGNALFLATEDTQFLLISCDLAALMTDWISRYTQAISVATGIPTDSVLIGCSHTHGGPSVLPTSYQKPVDVAYLERLQGWLCELAQKAVESAGPARLDWKTGEARLGYNRRVCFADGSHRMGRGTNSEAVPTGLEGPDDPSCLAIVVTDDDGELLAILHHGTGHPSSYYGGDALTAEYPGVARQLLREVYGPIPVLFFNGALGDIGPSQQTHPQATPNGRDVHLMRWGAALAGETLRLVHEMQPRHDWQLTHQRQEMVLPIRLPTQAMVEQGRAVLARIDAGEDIRGMDAIIAWGQVSLMERFGDCAEETLAFHAIRIGELAIVTQPFELFCQFQLDIKRRSPARGTAVFGITDGYSGYLPTLAGALGGGYSGVPLAWARFSPDVGCQVVDQLSAQLYELWN